MTNDESSVENRLLSIDRYPDPVAGYAAGEEPTVVAANDALEAAVGQLEAGTSLAVALDRFGVSTPADTGELPDLLVAGRERTVAAETNAGDYLARILPPTDDDCGYVLFVDRDREERPATGVDPGDGDSGTTAREPSDDPEDGLGIDRVASVLSHDLRNPLDVAKARLRAGRDGDDEHFEHVARAHDRMERIIEDVLTLSRGEEFIDPEAEVDLEAVAESGWETVETENATLAVVDGLPTTTADEDRVERLFENLFRNAAEHGDDPEVRVGRLKGGEGFYVADDGPGIPSEERSAVFEPGYSSHDHGTGLGLSIVERIAEAHGWHVAAVAADGGGARIEIRGVETRSDG
jgi:signal transduction histidine kinase